MQESKLAALQNQIAGESVANRDIHLAIEKIRTLNVADKIQIELANELNGFARELGAFALFGTVAQNSNPWLSDAENGVRINLPHNRELHQV